ncbi:MAG TPA: acyltransferase [Galbitalea sp.]|nr:acyltransferase [Galbitalea sp.]
MSEVSSADAAVASDGAPGVRRPRKHLWEVDVVRILTFLCVIAVHTTSHTIASSDLPLYLLLGLLHFTRNVFFALTAFVLVYSYLHKPVPMRKFWPRRFLLVGVPYVVWSVIYFTASNIYNQSHSSIGALALRLLNHILTGTAWYHLYFLLVTMQVYLLVPIILWLIRKTRGHHTALLVVTGAVQLVIVALYFYWPSTVSFLSGYTKEYFFSYIFFIIAGAVAADHYREFLPWVRRHRGAITIGVAVVAVVTLGVFLIQMAFGDSAYHAGTPLQPIVMVWGVAVALGFLAFGTWWADRRKPQGFGTKFVAIASDRSFGIFLSHPMFVWVLLWIGNDWFERTVPKPWLTLVIYLLVIAGAIGVTEIFRRTPLSLPLTGREFRAKPKHHEEPTPAASAD